MFHYPRLSSFFFFNDTATTEIYTLSLHDALPICKRIFSDAIRMRLGKSAFDFSSSLSLAAARSASSQTFRPAEDRKSTRLNSSHLVISYAVFCLKKKKNLNYWRCTAISMKSV